MEPKTLEELLAYLDRLTDRFIVHQTDLIMGWETETALACLSTLCLSMETVRLMLVQLAPKEVKE